MIDTEDGYERALLAMDVLTEIAKILAVGMSSPEYPVNAEGLIGEIREQLHRITDDSNGTYLAENVSTVVTQLREKLAGGLDDNGNPAYY
jgi:hypothetical protein